MRCGDCGAYIPGSLSACSACGTLAEPRWAIPSPGSPGITERSLHRGFGDIETAVVALVDRLAPIVPVAHQPFIARRIAETIVGVPSSMGNNMFIRQSIIRRGTASRNQVVDGLATWVTVLFDLANLRRDRGGALAPKAAIPDEALTRLGRALSGSCNGCIIAVPHLGSLELFVAFLKDLGFDVGFVYKIGDNPTSTERWILEGRSASGATPIQFGRRNTGAEISAVLRNGGIVVMAVDVYPSTRYKGVQVKIHDAEFRYPPGPARYAQSGTPVLPGFASARDTEGFSMNIFAPLEYSAGMPIEDAAADFTQRLAVQVGEFITERSSAYWLWHPIPNDPFLAAAQRQRPELMLSPLFGVPTDDEATALAVEALYPSLAACSTADLSDCQDDLLHA